MTFHQLTLSDREAIQAVTLPFGRRNCNYNFANLVGWQFLFGTEVCVLENAVVLRYTFNGQRAYMVCTSEALSSELIEALFDDSNGDLTLMGLEDSQVAQLSIFNFQLQPSRIVTNTITSIVALISQRFMADVWMPSVITSIVSVRSIPILNIVLLRRNPLTNVADLRKYGRKIRMPAIL